MTKLEIVMESLEKQEQDGKIIIVAKPEPEDNGFIIDSMGSVSTHDLKYKLAPKKPIYSPDGLNGLMMGLIPLRADGKRCFEVDPPTFYRFTLKLIKQFESYLRLGWLEFEEKFAESKEIEKTIVTITDKEVLKKMPEFERGKEFINEYGPGNKYRRILVRLFPDEKIARNDASNYASITLKDLKRYQRMTEGSR